MWLDFWRNLAVLWLAILCFIALLVPIVVLFFGVRAMNSAHGKTEKLLASLLNRTKTVHGQIDMASIQVKKPILRTQQKAAEFEQKVRDRLPRSLFPQSSRKRNGSQVTPTDQTQGTNWSDPPRKSTQSNSK
ncbi:hypothetical protein KFU94_16060 [Chloroflexi bacterium TSY]|nr:hypothetical protein [Chloroflexi bacterium TSY]